MLRVPALDVSPLQQPLTAEDLTRARGWLARAGQRDTRVRVVRWIMGGIGVLMLLLSLLGLSEGDKEMTIAPAVIAVICLGMSVGLSVRAAIVLRRHARLLAFAGRNALGYLARAVDQRYSALALQAGGDRITEHVLLGGPSSFGVHRMREGKYWLTWGFLLMLAHRQPGRAVAVPVDERGRTRTPVTWRLAQEDLRRAQRAGLDVREETWSGYRVAVSSEAPIPPGGEPFRPAVPEGLLELLRSTDRRLALDISGNGITVLAERGWDLTDPETQRLIHRIRTLVAASGIQPDAVAAAYGDHAELATHGPQQPVAFVERKDPAYRRRRVRFWLVAIASTVAAVASIILIRLLFAVLT